MTVLDYAMMIEDSHVDTHLVAYRRRGPDTAITGRGFGPPLAFCLTDVLADGLSMVYSFYDPEEAGRSPGTFMILDHIRRARRLGLRISTSATGSRARARWTTNPASARRSG